MANRLNFEVIEGGFIKPVEDNFFHTIFGYAWSDNCKLENDLKEETPINVFLCEETGNKICYHYKEMFTHHINKMRGYISEMGDCRYILPIENFRDELDRLIDCYNELINDWTKTAGISKEQLQRQSDALHKLIMKAQTEDGKGDSNYLETFNRNTV